MDKDMYIIEVRSLEERIDKLPSGYISNKNIKGKEYQYYQWNEDGKKKSKYLPSDQVENMRTLIELRRELEQKLRAMKSTKQIDYAVYFNRYETSVTTDGLVNMCTRAAGWERREVFAQLEKYLASEEQDKVCLVYGLRRTGKTTMLRQAIAMLQSQDENKGRVAYIKIKKTDNMAMLNRDMQKLYESGYRYIFIDEVTLMEDFIDSAAMFSDVYAAMGMKIVLSGTDSLGFWFTVNEELYDRAKLIHTTFIPYREYSRLLGIDSIDEYIRYGGTLRAGELDFETNIVDMEEASFKDDESTRRYIDTAICRNIQHSLACYGGGGHFRHLYSLYEADELTGAINRIIEDINHRFVLSVLTKDFISTDLHLSAKNLRNERNAENRTAILDEIDEQAVTDKLMEILDIRNVDNQSVGITAEHIYEIKEYLRALGLIEDCPTEISMIGSEPMEHILFVQPGMRYCQAQALVYAILQDETFLLISEREKERVSERILEEVRGRMLEDIVLLETKKAIGNQYKVFKLQFDNGEFDMVIYDKKTDSFQAYEIKHSSKIVPEQTKHLRDEKKLEQARRRFGELSGRYVLYLGEDATTEDGIEYRNAREYLKNVRCCFFTKEDANGRKGHCIEKMA